MSDNNGHNSNSNKALRWKQNSEIFKDVEFPSGCIADLKRLNTTQMITDDGSIPDAMYEAMMGGNQAQDEKAIMRQLKEAGVSLREFVQKSTSLSENAAVKVFVSPRIVENPNYNNDEIALSDLTDADKAFLWQWLTQGGEPGDALRRFRAAQQARSVAATSSMPKILPVSGEGNGDNG
jgi:hypothetical protein